jgi:beta-glucosidase
MALKRSDFGKDFIWGAATSAFQCEGGDAGDGSGLSIWDDFVNKNRKQYNGLYKTARPDFYNRYNQDLVLLKHLGFDNFRFSLSWPRIIPDGRGALNPQGVDFYNRVIDCCLELDITPWITLYHWDLPSQLQEKGGWCNRDIVEWFRDYSACCINLYGDRVKHWMVMNEPMAVSGAGHFIGALAPGKKGMSNFLPALHHTALCLAETGRVFRMVLPDAKIGTTFSCSGIEPYSMKNRDVKAAQRANGIINRIYPELLTGKGYDTDLLPVLKKMEKYMQAGDEKALKFSFDFWGLQPYTREVVRYSPLIPYVKARFVKPQKRGVIYTATQWEIYPRTIYNVIKEFLSIPEVPDIYITENGAAFHDVLENTGIYDYQRINYFNSYLKELYETVGENLPVKGYFVWSLTDNFEWLSGTSARFGIVYIDYKTRKRIIKRSGLWFKDFLKGTSGNHQRTTLEITDYTEKQDHIQS